MSARASHNITRNLTSLASHLAAYYTFTMVSSPFKYAAAALLLALPAALSQGHNHTGHDDHPCHCEAEEQKWEIDCTKKAVIQVRLHKSTARLGFKLSPRCGVPLSRDEALPVFNLARVLISFAVALSLQASMEYLELAANK